MYYPLIAKWTILPGNEVKATGVLKKLAQDVNEKEPGTLLYMVHVPNFEEKSLPTPPTGEVLFWEIYQNHEAFLAHINGPIFQDFVKTNGALFLSDFSTPPQVFMITEVLTQIEGFSRKAM
ncbi:antibiotic biosynthesis monooxygenase [Flavobacterium sp. LS1R49]|uniref:Antibiotic biosynthesis monooxygenase n=1 Tax=Flavobacterium shii TaxID=2987687 RepID=A0A9X3C4M6_9FLAO|nr:antibiotic biosynthesis monooxygenase [Flavobacterium shii]MCV9928229.1 antibiotic biosynthesis monooxygenase [Flavobacterium shii]